MDARAGPARLAPHRARGGLVLLLPDGLSRHLFDDGLDRFPRRIAQASRRVRNRAAMRLIAAIDEQANQIATRAMLVVRVSTFAGINQAGMVDTGEIDHAIVVDVAGVHASPFRGEEPLG